MKNNRYIDCVNEQTKPTNYYLNKKNEDYEPCYTTCATCENGGNFEENNYTSCDGIYFVKNPEDNFSSNCVLKCKYFYYLKNNNMYTCTDTSSCPEDYNYIIKDKKKCTNDCKTDKEYKYRYNSECFIKCPNNTQDDDDFICKDITKNDECLLTENNFNMLDDNTTFIEIENLVIKYIEEFNYTDNHVSLYKNGDYTITIYIKNKCIFELELGIPEINFGTCYDKILSNDESTSGKLITVIIDKKIDTKNTRKVLKYSFYSILTGEYIDSDEICKEEKIIIKDSIENKLLESKVDLNLLNEFVNEGIDIFNLSCPFYNDICFKYNSKKDIALKDRVLEYFPNITLCEEGCELMGINITTYSSICECYYSESKREDNLKNKVFEQAQIGALEEIISSSNIYVIKCYKLLKEIKYIKNCYGGYIFLCFILIDIIATIYFSLKNIFSITKYIFGLTNKYITYILEPNNNEKRRTKIERKPLNEKIKRKSKRGRKTEIDKKINFIFNNNKYMNDVNTSNKIKFNKEISKDDKLISIYKSPNYRDLSNSTGKVLSSDSKTFELSKEHNNLFSIINYNINIDINDYLETQYNDMDYDEAIRRDHRKFCVCFVEKLQDEQIIINTFFSDEPLKPKAIKIILLILQIKLYFFVNGLFYDEEYISKIYHLEKDTFFTMADRFIDNLIYAALVGIIVNYIVEFFL